MSLRLLPARLLPAELPLLPLPHPARHLSLSLPSRARSPPSASSSSSSTARTYPSQETPRLTLNVSGNGYSRPSSSAGGATAANADGMDARAHVGPFPMGVGMDSVQRKGASRPWSELSFGSKLYRAGQNSTALAVVVSGGLLFFVIAASVANELFSPNSSTQVFGRAVDLLEDSDDLKLYLIPPYTFHPPHASTPTRQASNTRMSLHSLPSRITRDPRTGVERHAFAFVVEGQEVGDFRSPTGWFGRAKARVETGVKGGVKWVKEELVKVGFVEPTVAVEEKKESIADQAAGVGSWLGGLVGLRRDAPAQAKSKAKGLPELGTFTTGEVHVVCEKNPQTHRLDLKSLTVSVPSRTTNTTFQRPYRFSVPVEVDDEASWVGKVSGWWEGLQGEAPAAGGGEKEVKTEGGGAGASA